MASVSWIDHSCVLMLERMMVSTLLKNIFFGGAVSPNVIILGREGKLKLLDFI